MGRWGQQTSYQRISIVVERALQSRGADVAPGASNRYLPGAEEQPWDPDSTFHLGFVAIRTSVRGEGAVEQTARCSCDGWSIAVCPRSFALAALTG